MTGREWTTPKTDWDPSQQGLTDADFNRIERNTEYLYDANKILDYDGNIYDTVQIGTQLWTTRDFRCTHYTDGSPIPLVNSAGDGWDSLTTGAYCKHNFNRTVYGFLYNWWVASSPLLAPPGWRVAGLADYVALDDYLRLNDYGFTQNGNNTGSSIATSYGWGNSNTPGNVGYNSFDNNSAGLSIGPGLARDENGGFITRSNSISYLWTDSESQSDPDIGGAVSLAYNVDRLTQGVTINKRWGCGIRLMRDI